MPEVNGQTFPYTKEGIKDAQTLSKASKSPVRYRYQRVINSAVKSVKKPLNGECMCSMANNWSF